MTGGRRLRGHPYFRKYVTADLVGTVFVCVGWLLLGFGWAAVGAGGAYLAFMLAHTYRLCRNWRDRTGNWAGTRD